ncbi:mycofactocin biosynthesis peptidyl-dipeptidase MftE [Amycolatopsis taiwanensis]|uniref:Mycofactocin system creatininase family protein n=1 Tax=Amycolatopsis taiwanensis TaxID=342230 RepID=A0A9W6RC74_9PSEU|nr:mycofactocin biosynthesis peptidyl-dipeptidase MftE [Amycolatopsis taiwanensis]GLY71417.1 mycofactocin system creatininase family protein [Amycolatopsis taiwanensis]
MTGLAELTWTELTGPRILAVPVGATEQHGPHLPFTVDTEIAVALCERLAQSREDVVVAPPVAYGSSGEHAGFPGTLSLGQEATELLLVELGRSADAFAGVLLVCAHGGNAEPVRRAVSLLRGEGRNVLAWFPRGPAEDSHAGRVETSVMLALRPSAVRPRPRGPGVTTPLPELIGRLRSGGVRAVSPTGVLGDPSGSSAAEGREILCRWAESLRKAASTLTPMSS